SDKKGTEGIDFGEEWYKRLMAQLQSTSDVVCLFTERSLDRPWILFEAGVAKGKLNTPVLGVALGVPLSRVSAGPFYQFMNMDDSEGDLPRIAIERCHCGFCPREAPNAATRWPIRGRIAQFDSGFRGSRVFQSAIFRQTRRRLRIVQRLLLFPSSLRSGAGHNRVARSAIMPTSRGRP